MDSFLLLYSETKKQVLTIIVVPLLLSAFYIITLEAIDYDKYFPLWASLIIFFGTIALSMIFFIKKLVNIPSRVTITTDGIDIKLLRTNIFHRKKKINIPFNNIKGLAEDVNTQDDSKYFTITTKHPTRSMLIMQGRKMKEEELEKFAALLHENINLYNKNPHTSLNTQIKEGSLFDAPWAHILTYTIYTLLVILAIAAILGAEIKGYKIIQAYAVGIAWLTAYHLGRNKSKSKKS